MKASRIAHEKKTVELMIRLYCRKKEKNTILCADCEELLRYAHARLDHCPFGEKKSACKECTVHCYKPVMRERMRQVMRFSGPRMLLNRNLLYTAVTRAKKCVTIVGSSDTVRRMIKNVNEQKRYSTLCQRIIEMGEYK